MGNITCGIKVFVLAIVEWLRRLPAAIVEGFKWGALPVIAYLGIVGSAVWFYITTFVIPSFLIFICMFLLFVVGFIAYLFMVADVREFLYWMKHKGKSCDNYVMNYREFLEWRHSLGLGYGITAFTFDFYLGRTVLNKKVAEKELHLPLKGK